MLALIEQDPKYLPKYRWIIFKCEDKRWALMGTKMQISLLILLAVLWY